MGGGIARATALRQGGWAGHAALDAFYRAWFDRAVALVASLTRRDEAFCLDAVQDAFLRLVRRPPPVWVDSPELLDAWFTRIVHAAALDRLRSDSRRAARDRASDAVGSPPTNPAHAAQTGELVRRLEHLITELDAHEHALLRARTMSGAGLAQIGAAVGLTVGAVHGRLRRITSRLARAAASDQFDHSAPDQDVHREDQS